MSGRVRSDRVDTGLAVYQNEERVRIDSIRSLLARQGFWLADAYWFQKPSFGNKEGQCVINLTLSRTISTSIKLPRSVMGELRKLARENIWRVSVWDNSNLGNPSTVNFSGRLQGSPNRSLIIRDEFLCLVTPDGEDAVDAERIEDARIGSALISELEEISL